LKVLAIIPARGGSKRIPQKNIKKFCGQPVISYPIKAALNSKVFDEIMVSTDDNDIGKISLKYGAKIPFIRSQNNSDDFAGTDAVLKEVLNYYIDQGIKFEAVCCIYPVNPFVNEVKIKEGLEKLRTNNFDCVFSAVKYSYPIQRSFRLDKEDKMRMIEPQNYLKRSQDLDDTYHDAGQFYWFKTSSFLEKGKLWTDNTSIIELNDLEVQDIDSDNDWKVAELKFQIQKSLNHN
jgi:N-acylneuraminate cytidylyltransferase